jgi:hypothetical protein
MPEYIINLFARIGYFCLLDNVPHLFYFNPFIEQR